MKDLSGDPDEIDVELPQKRADNSRQHQPRPVV